MTTIETNVFEQSLPFQVERHYFGEQKSTSTDNIEVNERTIAPALVFQGETTPAEKTKTDKHLLAVRKRILDSDQVRAIRLRDKKFRDFLASHSTPWKAGLFLVGNDLIRDVGTEAEIWEAERGQLADAAALDLPNMIESMRKPLGALFNIDDYATPETFRAAYTVAYRFIDYGVARQLQSHRHLLEREQRRVQSEARDASRAIQQHLRGSALAIVEHLRDLLEPSRPGHRRKQLRGTCLDDLLTFLRTYAAQNLTGDDQLTRVVAQLTEVNRTLDLEILREDDQVRARAHEAMTSLHAQLDELVEDAPERQIRVRDVELVS